MTLSALSDENISVITLNRPEVLNALDDESGYELLRAFGAAAEDDSVRCIVITGAGKGFCAGADLGALAGGYRTGEPPDLGHTVESRYNPLIRAIRNAEKPVVAAVNGVAAGAGASIALACDFRILSSKAKLVLAFIKVGLVPDSGGLWFLTKMVGSAKAWELAATGDPLSAEEALRLGLATQVVEPDDFEPTWRSFAGELATGPTQAYALTKSLASSAAERGLDEQLDLEVAAQRAAGKTEDHLEGVNAFLEKRPPRFKGR
jgi:2-(1,2-epoxy-1,2-dihydrophenyl)acetyl-CoA isomerase